MYKEGKAQRNADGKIIKAAAFQSRGLLSMLCYAAEGADYTDTN
jgi:hypothetical protein